MEIVALLSKFRKDKPLHGLGKARNTLGYACMPVKLKMSNVSYSELDNNLIPVEQ